MAEGLRLLRDFEAVSDAAQGLEILGMAGIGLDLLAQTADVNVNRAGSDEGSFLPDGVEQLIARQNAAAMRGEVFQQAKFTNRGRERCAR